MGTPNPYASDCLQSQGPILVTLIWVLVFIAILAPLSSRKYRTISR